jgi:hypothetical protein
MKLTDLVSTWVFDRAGRMQRRGNKQESQQQQQRRRSLFPHPLCALHVCCRHYARVKLTIGMRRCGCRLDCLDLDNLRAERRGHRRASDRRECGRLRAAA